MTNETKKLIGIKKLLQNSWNIYQKDFKKLMIISLVTFGVVQLFTVFIAPEITTPVQVQTSPYAFFTLPFYWYSPIWLLTFLLSIFGSAVLISAIKATPQDWSVKVVLKEGLTKFLPFLIASVLVGLIIGLGFILLIIPGIIFSIWFALVSYTVICEDKRNFGALKRSKELVKGYWWSVLGRFLCLALIMVIFSILFQSILRVVGAIAFPVLASPFGISYGYLLYKNLKEIKGEGGF